MGAGSGGCGMGAGGIGERRMRGEGGMKGERGGSIVAPAPAPPPPLRSSQPSPPAPPPRQLRPQASRTPMPPAPKPVYHTSDCCQGTRSCCFNAEGCCPSAGTCCGNEGRQENFPLSRGSGSTGAFLAPAPLKHPMSNGGYDVPLATHVATNSRPIMNEIADHYRR